MCFGITFAAGRLPPVCSPSTPALSTFKTWMERMEGFIGWTPPPAATSPGQEATPRFS